MTISLGEYRALSRVDRQLIREALNDYIERLNDKGGGTLTGAPPQREH